MGRPHFAIRWIECHGFRVGDVVAKLRFFAAMDRTRRNLK
jgi:hypothetical protein